VTIISKKMSTKVDVTILINHLSEQVVEKLMHRKSITAGQELPFMKEENDRLMATPPPGNEWT
jgi:hypothetical protein